MRGERRESHISIVWITSKGNPISEARKAAGTISRIFIEVSCGVITCEYPMYQAEGLVPILCCISKLHVAIDQSLVNHWRTLNLSELVIRLLHTMTYSYSVCFVYHEKFDLSGAFLWSFLRPPWRWESSNSGIYLYKSARIWECAGSWGNIYRIVEGASAHQIRIGTDRRSNYFS